LLLPTARPSPPRERSELMVLPDALILERALYELGRELGRRHGAQPQWTGIALHSTDQFSKSNRISDERDEGELP
jgi:hypothetical protein